MEAHKQTLVNGLRFVGVPMVGTSTASVVVMVHAGSRYENRRNNGIAHFLEHMGFKGARRHRDARAVAEAIERVGGKSNAFTNRESIAYYAKVPAEHYALALDVLSDMLFNSRLDPNEIEKERGVILEELSSSQDNPADFLNDEFGLHILGDHPLGWPILGREESLRKITQTTLRRYIRKHFIAEKMVLAIAGNVNSEEAFAQATEYFSEPLPPHTSQASFRPYVPQRTEPVRIVRRDTAQTHLMLGARIVAQTDPQRYPAEVAATILGSGMSSRLFLEVREQRGLAYAVSAGNQLFADAGVFFIYAGVKNQRAQEAASAILTECLKLREESVGDEELKKSKSMIIGGLRMGMEDSFRCAAQGAAHELLYGNPAFILEHIARINAVTSEDVRSYAREFFGPDSFRITLVGPHEDPTVFESLLQS